MEGTFKNNAHFSNNEIKKLYMMIEKFIRNNK